METYEEKNKVIPYCISILINNKQFTFYDSKNIIMEVLNLIVNNIENNKILIFIHNLNFDGILIIEEITKKYIPFEIKSEKTNIYQLKIKYCNKLIFFRCSFKIIPISLKELGNIENFKKLSFPYKFVNSKTLNYMGEIPNKNYWEDDDYAEYMKQTEKNFFDLKNETIKYCENDVILTQKVLKNLFKIIDEEDNTVRKISLSAPSMSHKLFFKKYNQKEIIENLKIEDDSFIRKSFFGGRCEIFGNSSDGEIIKYFDFSGMYGQCMMEKFHCGKQYYDEPSKIEKIGFYNIDYISSFPYLPILPSHRDNKLFFTNGIKNGTFWFEEIKLFQDFGGKIVKINSAILYENFEEVFKDFIQKFSEKRKEGGYYKIFAKLMINSLYGSMALKDKENLQYLTFSEEEFKNIYKNTTVKEFYKINECIIISVLNDYKAKHYFRDEHEKAKKRRNVSYASAIASKARIKLYKELIETQRDGGKILYCDTDSIFASYDKNDKRMTTKTFNWIETFDDAVFMLPKTYALKNKEKEIIKIKGIRNKNINFNELKSNFYSEKKIVFSDQLNFRKSDFILKQFYSLKNINLNEYDKRIFYNNKKNTKPINE